MAEHRRWTLLALVVVLCTGAALRLHHLGDGTVGHIEIYVPRIDLPYDLSDPRPRFTVMSILTGSTAAEPHPPGYYLFMWVWTKWFGTGAVSIRLPSAVCGIASIAALYVIGTLEAGQPAALLAAAMLALNGLHIFWSQIAKMYVMACCLGLLSTAALLLMIRCAGTRSRLLQWCYVGTTLLGLGTVTYAWPIFATQMLWILRGNWKERQRMPAPLQWQLFVFVLASPLWALAMYQGRRESYLSSDVMPGFIDYLGFGFLFEPDRFRIPPQVVSPLAAALLAICAVAIFIVGARAQTEKPRELPTADGPSRLWMAAVTLVALAGILGFSVLAHAQDPSRTAAILACTILPVLAFALDAFMRRNWKRVQRIGMRANDAFPVLSGATGNALSVLLAVVPVTLVIALTPLVPLFASRGVLLYAPYFILILASGLIALCRHGRPWVILVLLVLALHGVSAVQAKRRIRHPVDYRALAEHWVPQIRDTDLIFVQRSWATTPIFYYMKGSRYHFVGGAYADVTRAHPDARVWFLSCNGLPMTPEMSAALAGYDKGETVQALRAQAVVFVPVARASD